MTEPVLTVSPTGDLRIWDHPVSGQEYVLGADVAEGKARDVSMQAKKKLYKYSDSRPDYSAIVVLEVVTGLHVASWHGYLSPDEFAVAVAAVGFYYNKAHVVVELNGPGLAVLTRLQEQIRYDNLYRQRYFNTYDRDPYAPQFGWQTNRMNRKILITHIHSALNSGSLFTRDAALVDELRTLEYDDQGTERARGKHKDDRVFALALALEGRHAVITETDLGIKPRGRTGFDKLAWSKLDIIEQHGSFRAADRAGSRSWSPRPSRPLG